jgi:hypothetical protein
VDQSRRSDLDRTVHREGEGELTAGSLTTRLRRSGFNGEVASVVLEVCQDAGDVHIDEAKSMVRWQSTRKSTVAGIARRSSCGARWSLP